MEGVVNRKGLSVSYTYTDVAKMIDHSLLIPTMTAKELEDGIGLAIAYDVASVCIMPYYLKRCAELLSGTTVKPFVNAHTTPTATACFTYARCWV